jgi:hypothetical protein
MSKALTVEILSSHLYLGVAILAVKSYKLYSFAFFSDKTIDGAWSDPPTSSDDRREGTVMKNTGC